MTKQPTKTALKLAEEAILFFQKRCNEQGFYSPCKQPLVLEALEAIKKAKESSNEWQHPKPSEIYDLIREGAADGGWQGFAFEVSSLVEKKNT